MKTTRKLLILIFIPAICLVYTGESNGQHSVELNLNVSSEIQSSLYSPDIQAETDLGYRNTFYHIKNDLYLFGKVAAFYQLDNLSWHYSHASDVSQYDYNRYGGSVTTGFFLEGPVLNAELGFGVTAHHVIQNKTREGMLPPGTTPSSPDRIKESFNTFDVNLALMYRVMDLFDLRFGLRLQSPFDQQQLNHTRISPGFGLVYIF